MTYRKWFSKVTEPFGSKTHPYFLRPVSFSIKKNENLIDDLKVSKDLVKSQPRQSNINFRYRAARISDHQGAFNELIDRPLFH